MTRSSIVVAITASLLGISSPATAEPIFVVGSDWTLVVPSECRGLLPKPPETPLYWDRWLSLAACLQDNSIDQISDPDQLAPMVRDHVLATAPAMMLYHEALGSGPEVVQLRAAYHVGLAAVALITRARRSIHASDAQTEQLLRDRLEPLLDPMKDMARTAFWAVIRGASDAPETASDPVGRNMVKSATTLLRALSPPRRAESFDIARN